MSTTTPNKKIIQYALIWVWVCNCILGSIIAIKYSWLPNISAGIDKYPHIVWAPFDGTVSPILFIPDWSNPSYRDKSLLFDDIPIKDYMPLPRYDANFLADTNNPSKASFINHYTYTTLYMWSYRLNYKEHDGSHLAVDIRAPIWTPVLSIANGVVVRTIESDGTGNKLVVIRHDNVPMNGKKVKLYSGYLHLSQINVQEGTKIYKWDMIGRVGITGITTTPHLHFQIDTADAPFHPYWPFTSAESRAAGLGFFDSVNAWLGKNKAEKYTIHPMEFVNAYTNGIHATSSHNKKPEPKAVNAPLEKIVAEMNLLNSAPTKSTEKVVTFEKSTKKITPPNTTLCTKKYFWDINQKSHLAKIVYTFVDKKCMFQNISTFNPKWSVTMRDAITMIMQYNGIKPANGTSSFLDIPIGDEFQGYALVAYQRGIIEWNYAYSDRILSKEEFVKLIVDIGRLKKNPNQVKIFKDVDAMNLYFDHIQSYAWNTKKRGGIFSPKSLMTREMAVTLLNNLYQNGK